MAPWDARLYQEWIDTSDLSRQQAHDKAPGPEVTTEAMVHAMTSPKPKTRSLAKAEDGYG